MSLPPPPVQRSLLDVESLLGREFDPADRFRLFREKVYPLLLAARPQLEACYCAGNGRRAEEPVVLLGATVMQFMERSPDRRAAECVAYHLGWKLALGLELSVGAFHPTTLCTFRERLLRHEKAKVAFDAVLSGLVEAGLVPRRSKQRLDSTHVLGLVAKMGRLECVREALRLALQEVAKALAGMEEAKRPGLPAWWPLLWERYVESKADYRAEEASLAEKLRQAGADADLLLRWAPAALPGGGNEGARAMAAGKHMLLLGRVFRENFEAQAGEAQAGPGATSPGAKLPPPEPRRATPPGAVRNPHDPEAQWSTKSNPKLDPPTAEAAEAAEAAGTPPGGEAGAAPPEPPGPAKPSKDERGWVGYKVQVSETVQDGPREEGEPTASFLTAVETQPATGSDYAGLEQVLGAQAASGLLPPSELYVDTAFVSAAGLRRAEQEGRELVGPAQPARDRGRGFKSDEFDVDVEGRKATCPAGHASTNCSRLEEKATGKVSFRFEWGGKGGPCADCPLRGKCLSPGVGHRTLVVGQDHSHLQKRRLEMKTDAFKQRMRRRNAIEGTISELARGHGLRRARSRGLKKVALQNYLIGAACNAKRWVRRAAWELKQQADKAAEAARAAAAGAARALAGATGAAAGA